MKISLIDSLSQFKTRLGKQSKESAIQQRNDFSHVLQSTNHVKEEGQDHLLCDGFDSALECFPDRNHSDCRRFEDAGHEVMKSFCNLSGLTISSIRLAELVKSLGCRVNHLSKREQESSGVESGKVAVLSLPLRFPKPPSIKRKK